MSSDYIDTIFYKPEAGKECRWCGRVFSETEVPERFCSDECAQHAAGINLRGDSAALADTQPDAIPMSQYSRVEFERDRWGEIGWDKDVTPRQQEDE